MKHLIIALFSLSVAFLSIDTNAQNDCFSIAPNPANGFTTITWGDADYTGELRVIIFDITGKQIEEMLIDRYDKPFLIDIALLESGLYVVQIVSSDSLSLCNVMKLWVD